MSRHELGELERVLREKEIEEQERLERGSDAESEEEQLNATDLAALMETPDFFEIREEVLKLQPMRIATFKKYWEKFKYNKTRREKLVEMFDESDEQVKFWMGDHFVEWQDEIEGVRVFLDELKRKKLEADVAVSMKGNTVIRTIKGENEFEDLQEIEYNVKTFNPFDQLNIKTQEGKIRKTYIEKDIGNVSDGSSGLTLGTTPTEETDPTDLTSDAERSDQTSEAERETMQAPKGKK